MGRCRALRQPHPNRAFGLRTEVRRPILPPIRGTSPVEYATEHLAELKATGIPGFVRYTLDQPNVRVQATTWEAWIASGRKLLGDFEASQRP